MFSLKLQTSQQTSVELLLLTRWEIQFVAWWSGEVVASNKYQQLPSDKNSSKSEL